MANGLAKWFGMVVSATALVVPCAAAAAGLARLDRDPPKVFRALIVPDATVAATTERARALFERNDADGDGLLTPADGRFADRVGRAIGRAGLEMNILQFDLDGDGAVAEEELRSILRYERRTKGPRAPLVGATDEVFEKRVRMMMDADGDRDGRITFAETLAAARKVSEGAGTVAGLEAVILELLDYAGTSDEIAQQTFLDLLVERMQEIDADGDGRLTAAEIDASTLRRADRIKAITADRRRKEEAERRRRSTPPDASACAWPQPSASALAMLVSVYEAQALSTAAIGSQDIAVGTASVVVEPGEAPLALVLLSHRPVIWRFSGAVERIERAVLISSLVAEEAATASIVGATGLDRDKVAFAPPCVEPFTANPSIEGSKVAAEFRARAGRNPIVAANYTMVGVKVPSGTFDVVPREGAASVTVTDSKQVFATFGGRLFDLTDASLSRKLRWAHPGGVVEVDPGKVIASGSVAPYEILPGVAGIAQLVSRGALGRNASGEYLVRDKIRLPGGLYGSSAERFLLLDGAPVPDGNPGDGCVYAQETGKVVLGDAGCR